MKEKLNGLDLFSGGGFLSESIRDYAETRCYCEREVYPQAVLLQRMERGQIDNAPIWDDVCSLQGQMLPPINLVTAGWPCQGNSYAGKGKGMQDERSALVAEVIRLVGEIRPTVIFLENTPGAITLGDGLGYILHHLAPMGYDCRWGLFRGEGSPHKRERMFLMAHSDGFRWPEVLRDRARVNKEEGERWEGTPLDSPSDTLAWFEKRTGEPAIFGVDDARWDSLSQHRLKVHGNSVMVPVAKKAFETLGGLVG